MRSKNRRWLGVDGEGVGRGPHRYVLLACSDGDYIQDRRGLSTVDCLEFLLDLSTRDVRLCGYYLGYDWTKILADLDDRALGYLFRPELRARPHGAFERVEYKRYKLHWLAGAVWISDDRDRRATVWDLGKYYQGPFVDALKAWGIRLDVQKQIARMKKRRAVFTYKEIVKIREYCLHECEALAELATNLEQAHIDADLKPRGWFGPGSTASVLLRRYSIQEKRGIVPPVMLEPVATAFFGGRAEISRNGFVPGPISAYDISSAYPYHASRLPCLEHGRWERVTRERALTGAGVVGALVHGHIRCAPGAWAPLPVRLQDDSIVFPSAGASGFWWRDEWLAARRGWGKGLKFDHAYVLRKECDCKPFDFIPELFAYRLHVGKETGEGKILKLGLNSIYGKLAQTIGGAQYASRVWAGMITSNTRAQVLDLMLRHKRLDSVLMIATDGLFSTEAISAPDICAEGDKSKIALGGWEHKVYESMTLVKSGMYWLGKEKLRARGIGRADLDKGQRRLKKALEAGAGHVELNRRVRFGGAKLTVLPHAEDGCFVRSEYYGEWYTIPTGVTLTPGPKRAPDWSPPTLCDVDSKPYGVARNRVSQEGHEIMQLIRELLY